jgi:hypothetical protein
VWAYSDGVSIENAQKPLKRGRLPVADKPKIKKVKMELILDQEQRECLIEMLKGGCECVSLDNVCF